MAHLAFWLHIQRSLYNTRLLSLFHKHIGYINKTKSQNSLGPGEAPECHNEAPNLCC